MRHLTDVLRLVSAGLWLGVVGAFFAAPVERAMGLRSGMLVQVGSEMAGAVVHVGGQERGKAPALMEVECRHGELVEIVVELAGRQLWREEVECRPGETVEAGGL